MLLILLCRNSLFVDSPGNETLDRAYCWCPSCNHGMLPADDSCLKVMDSRSISRNSSPSMSFEIDEGVTMPLFDWCNMEDDNFQPTKVRLSPFYQLEAMAKSKTCISCF